jgi:(1->4)-alpha-D-glucan 1-alpha-D-glucosylmutase
MTKAAREAKRHTSWTNPNADYEEALLAFVRSALARVKPNPVLSELQGHAQRIAWFGAINSLSLVLLKYASPGVPDLYQGNELIDLSLVDPDNRRPVDYALRERWLGELQALSQTRDWPDALRSLSQEPTDGRLKLWLTWRLLQLRREHEALLSHGDYQPLATPGAKESHLVAFARSAAGEQLVAVATRLPAQLLGFEPAWPVGEAVWADTVIELGAAAEGRAYEDVLTGQRYTPRNGRLRVAEVLGTLPVAALVAVESAAKA